MTSAMNNVSSFAFFPLLRQHHHHHAISLIRSKVAPGRHQKRWHTWVRKGGIFQPVVCWWGLWDMGGASTTLAPARGQSMGPASGGANPPHTNTSGGVQSFEALQRRQSHKFWSPPTISTGKHQWVCGSPGGGSLSPRVVASPSGEPPLPPHFADNP